jgi:hypothetical protein
MSDKSVEFCQFSWEVNRGKDRLAWLRLSLGARGRSRKIGGVEKEAAARETLFPLYNRYCGLRRKRLGNTFQWGKIP